MSPTDTVTWCPSWRSPSGTTEDRNCGIAGFGPRAAVWRSPSGTTEDRNSGKLRAARDGVQEWRSPSGATEDRTIGS
ncbi:hypothetical protein [Streptomyces cyaneofuscatus]|uniref:hypothetical protein n=1 Tax=Streptomyces cyaneofuscatus TaxID=66883 RepID=UPI00386C81A5